MAAAPALRAALVTAAVLVAGPTAAELPADADAIAEHMAFLGYQCERRPDAIHCTHPQLVNTNVRGLAGGTMLITYFATEDTAKRPEARLGVLEFVNTMNANSGSVIFFIDAEGDLGASTWFAGRYDKARFGQTLERWNTDLRDALQRDPERSRALIR